MVSIDPQHEQNRLDTLGRYDILDTADEESFDRITRMVRRILNVPIATLSFLDAHRMWLKSRQGLDVCEIDRRSSFCDIAIRHDAPLVVPDTLSDPRFVENIHVTGAPHLRFYAGIPLSSRDGHNIGTLCAMDTKPRTLSENEIETLTDLAQIVMNELELRLQASTDPLTGALSRRVFREEATRAIALAQRHRHELSLIAFDLDHFKRVNDTHGHAVGDTVLIRAITACRDVLRRSDLIARLGGEEFCVLLPHTGLRPAMEVAEKVRARLAELVFAGEHGPFRTTASFGVASLGQHPDLDALLQAADEALYAAKASGRTRCVASPPITIDPAAGRRVLKAGHIVFNHGQSVIDCTVRRLSDRGANLAVISTAGVPERFKLAIEADEFSKLCAVTRKAGAEIDVAFA